MYMHIITNEYISKSLFSNCYACTCTLLQINIFLNHYFLTAIHVHVLYHK